MVSDAGRGGAGGGAPPCLNPCSNGIWSLTEVKIMAMKTVKVLILVLMEYGL